MSQATKTNLYSIPNEETASDMRPPYSSIRLMELPPALLALIESPDPPKLTIKASPSGTAILNTPSKSFLLRNVDQSNSLMMFAPSESDGFNLVHTAKQYLELVSNPNRVKLEGVLPEWNGEGTTDNTPMITMGELRRCIAASDLEIDSALNAVFAVEFDGYVYRMSPTYISQLLDLVITTAVADSLNLQKLLSHDLTTSPTLDGEIPECIETILTQFSHHPIELSSLLVPVYNIDHSKVLRWYGLRTLASQNIPIRVAQFLEKWQSNIPAAIDKATPDMELLVGNFHYPSPGMVQYLPAQELSSVPEQRFAQLFQVKEKWEVNEIMPFLEGCVESGGGWEKKAERECQKWARVRGGMVMKR